MTKKEILAQLADRPAHGGRGLGSSRQEQTRKGSLYCKVSPKGAMSLYVCNACPSRSTSDQWERL